MKSISRVKIVLFFAICFSTPLSYGVVNPFRKPQFTPYTIPPSYTVYGVDKRDYENLERTQLAAKYGHPEAQYRLGELYYKGRYVEKDYRKALEWFEAAAEQGHAEAEGRLVEIYSKVKGLKESFKNAEYWEKRLDSLIKQCY